jgi:hypothetical protein
MGAGAFNGRVRDGIGFWAHRSNHQTGAGQGVRQAFLSLRICVVRVGRPRCGGLARLANMDHESDQARSSD